MPGAALITVVEMPEFLSATRKLLTEEERAVLVDYLANNRLPATWSLVSAECANCDGGQRDVGSVAAPA